MSKTRIVSLVVIFVAINFFSIKHIFYKFKVKPSENMANQMEVDRSNMTANAAQPFEKFKKFFNK